MRKVNCLTLGLLLLAARAEKDSQGYQAEQTKGTTVTKDLLLKRENTTGRDTDALPSAAVTAETPEVVVSAAGPAPPLEGIQMTNTATVQERLVLASQRGESTATSVHTKSEMPLISNYEKIALSTTQAAFESMMNDTSEPGVNLSTDAVKSSLWRRTLHDNSQPSAGSIPLTSADRGLGVPVLSASHPHVIDNLAALPHDNDDKQAQGKDEKESSTLQPNKYPSGTMQSIIQKPVLSHTVSTDSLGVGLALDFNQFTTSPGTLPGKFAGKQEQSPRYSSPSFNKTIQTSVTQRDSEKQWTSRAQQTLARKVSSGSPPPKLHPSLSTNSQNAFVPQQPSDVGSGSVSNVPVVTQVALSSQGRVFHQGGDGSAASRPSEARRTAAPFRFGKPTSSAVRDPESHSLTARAASLIPVVRSRTPAKPRSHTKELVLTLLPKDSAIKSSSAARKTRDPHTFNTLNSIIQQSIVYAPGPANKAVMKEEQMPTSAPVNTGVLSDSSQESDDVVPTSPLLSKSSSGRLTPNRFIGTRSKITQEKTSDVTTHQSFTRYNVDLRTESQIVHSLKLGDKREQVWIGTAEDHQDVTVAGSKQREDIQDSEERQKLQHEEKGRGNNRSEDKTEGLLKSDEAAGANKRGMITKGAKVSQKTGMEDTGGIEEEEEAKENRENLKAHAAANQSECLTAEGGEGMARFNTLLLHNRETGSEDVTNVPPGATAGSKEPDRDTGRTVRNSSSCRSLIQRSGATEKKDVYLAAETPANMEMKHKVTSNHGRRRTTLRSDAPSLTDARARSQVSQFPFSAAVHAANPKHTSGVRGASSPSGGPTESAHPVTTGGGNTTSPAAPRLTAGLLRAEPGLTASSSARRLAIIHSTSNHGHKFSTSVTESKSLVQTVDDSRPAGSSTPARLGAPLPSDLVSRAAAWSSASPASPRQLDRDASARPLTAETLSSGAHASIGRPLSYQGQSVGQMSRSSPPVDANKHRSAHTLTATMSPEAKRQQLSLLLNPTALRGDGLPDTYGLTAITRSGAEKGISRRSEDRRANSDGGPAESSLAGENDSVVTSARSDAARESRAETSGRGFVAQTAGGREATGSAEEVGSASLSPTETLAVDNANETEPGNPFDTDLNNGANTAGTSTPDTDRPSQLDASNETGTAGQTIHTTHFLPGTSDSALLVLDRYDGISTAALTQSDHSVPEVETGQQHGPPAFQDSVAQVSSRRDPNASRKPSEFQMSTTKDNDFVSPAARINAPVSGDARESLLTTNKQVVAETPSQDAHAERRLPTNSQIESLPPATPTRGKHGPAVEREDAAGKQPVEASARAAAVSNASPPEVTRGQTTAKSAGWTLLAGTQARAQLHVGAAGIDTLEAQKASRSVEDAPVGQSGLQPEVPAWKHRRRTRPHLYRSGVTEVSEDLCGSGNYTAEMSLNLGRDVEPGDAVPVLGNLRVIINLKTNNSLINLEVTSCCLSPTVQPDLTNSTCCLFSRLAAEPAGITLLPSALSTSASFTISLFQMINYSVVYLHCDLSVCLRNRSDCERECLQQRSAFPLEGPEAIVTNLRNRISFGPMLKAVRNSTFLEEIDPSELDLALVIISLVVGFSLVTIMLLLVWLAYRRRTIWLLPSAAPPRACCGCVRPGGDLILP